MFIHPPKYPTIHSLISQSSSPFIHSALCSSTVHPLIIQSFTFHLFKHLFTRLLVHMSTHSAILTSKFHSSIHLFTPSFVPAILCLTAHPSIHPFVHSPLHPVIHSFLHLYLSSHPFISSWFIPNCLCTHYFFICPLTICHLFRHPFIITFVLI